MIDLEKLKAAALLATPGEWINHERDDGSAAVAASGMQVAQCQVFDPFGQDAKNAKYIAEANPSVIIKLIERLQIAENSDWYRIRQISPTLVKRRRAKEKAEVMLAFADGEKVEFREEHDTEWSDAEHPSWQWGYIEYRIKPKY